VNECALTLGQHLWDDAAVRARVPVLGRVRVPTDLLRDPLRLRRPAVLLDACGIFVDSACGDMRMKMLCLGHDFLEQSGDLGEAQAKMASMYAHPNVPSPGLHRG
jgi:hypothetical protein